MVGGSYKGSGVKEDESQKLIRCKKKLDSSNSNLKDPFVARHAFGMVLAIVPPKFDKSYLQTTQNKRLS